MSSPAWWRGQVGWYDTVDVETQGTDAMITFYPDLQRHSLLRTPDWRWRRARWLVERGRYFSRRRDDHEFVECVLHLLSEIPNPAKRVREPYSLHALQETAIINNDDKILREPLCSFKLKGLPRWLGM